MVENYIDPNRCERKKGKKDRHDDAELSAVLECPFREKCAGL